MEDIKIAGVMKESCVDGPGMRYVIFTQGCPHHCPGCHNPQTHDACGGRYRSMDDLLEDIHKNPIISGVTFSGGEPFLQAKKLSKLAKKLRDENYDVRVYTGYEYEYLKDHSNDSNGYMDLLKNADVLVDGKFDLNKKIDSENGEFKGSSNQRVIDLKETLKNGMPIIRHEVEIE